MRWVAFLAALSLLSAATSWAAPPPTGYLPEVQVSELTRFDWEFVARNGDAEPGKLPREYDSRQQFYVLHAPKAYDPARAWPLILFVSPGDDPLGWRLWQKTCEQRGLFFCAAYGAGNRTPTAQRARLVLDALDDIRRHYRIDPDRTYTSGHAGAGRFASALAFSLPEHFGGVVVLSGAGTVETRWTEPLHRVPYLRHRARERLSVAVVTADAEDDSATYFVPMLDGLGLRARAWPTAETFGELYDWLEAGQKRKQADAKVRPKLTVAPSTAPTPSEEAEGLVQTAEREMLLGEGVWRGVALLEGVVQRWPKTEPGEKAVRLLRELSADARKRDLARTQRESEERQVLIAEAQALERSGRVRAALERWVVLRKQAPDTPEGTKAVEEMKRLEVVVSGTPYLGAAFQDGSTTVADVVAGSPAERAGLRAGDVIVRFAAQPTATLAVLRRTLATLKAGAKVEVERTRDGKSETVMVQLVVSP